MIEGLGEYLPFYQTRGEGAMVLYLMLLQLMLMNA